MSCEDCAFAYDQGVAAGGRARTDLLEACKAALPNIREQAEGITYGAPACDDPRDFSPDKECCSPKEIAAWEEACAKAASGEYVQIPRHKWLTDDDGNTTAHVAYQPWGIGTSKWSDPDMVKLRDDIDAAIQKAEGQS